MHRYIVLHLVLMQSLCLWEHRLVGGRRLAELQTLRERMEIPPLDRKRKAWADAAIPN